MGEAIITRRYNAEGLTDTAYAAISISYTPGCICTCSCGETFFAARDTSGGEAFSIPYAGTWTVTAADPTGNKNPISKTVTVNAHRIYYVSIGFGKEFFTAQNGLASGYNYTVMQMQGLAANGDGDYSLASGSVGVDANGNHAINLVWSEICRAIIYFKPKITVTDFTKLSIAGKQIESWSGYYLTVGLTRNIPANTNDAVNYVVSTSLSGLNTESSSSVSLENITGDYYVVASSNYTGSGYINSILFS
jgi:hypothetical protein